MDKLFGLYVVLGMILGAVFGIAVGQALGNQILGIVGCALIGVFIGWFSAAAVGASKQNSS